MTRKCSDVDVGQTDTTTLTIWAGLKAGVINSVVVFSSPSTVTEFIGEDIQSYQSGSQMDN